MRASSTNYAELHPGGILAWHWFHGGGDLKGYGFRGFGTGDDVSVSETTHHRFVPYWFLILPLTLTAAVLYPRPPRTTP